MLRADGEDMSEEFLHWAAKGRDGLPQDEEGTTLAAAARSLADLGQPPERTWPYDDTRDQWASTYQPPADTHAEAKARRLRGGHVLEPTPAALRRSLDANLAVLLGVRLYQTWHDVGTDGRIDVPASDAMVLGGHAILVVGYDDGDGVGRGHFIVRNSWGSAWGHNGYAYLPYGYVEAHGLQAWVLAREADG
jgi:hypothetical protein